MAEGWARHLKGDQIEAYSAGTEPQGMNPLAVRAMRDAGVDISQQHSKHVRELRDPTFDFVVTVCGHANETCPEFHGKTKVVHVGFDDPPALAKSANSEEQAMTHYRRVRDEIKAYVASLPQSLINKGTHMSTQTESETTGTTPCCDSSCCGAEKTDQTTGAEVTSVIREKYGSTAKSGLSSQHEGVRAVAQAFGYTAEELASIPAEANMGLSCGNPTATANLRPGEVVVDLGSGGGLDVFLAAKKVGRRGKAIGIDMTPEMIELARKNATKSGLTNVEFHHATIDKLPLADASVDCIISNCVINLAPNKQAVFREIARVLKSGGRLAVSDIALKNQLPAEIGNDVMAYVGCIAGAISISDYRAGLAAAGFAGVEVVDTGADLNAYAKVENQAACCAPTTTSSCCGPEQPSTKDDKALHDRLKDMLQRYNVNDYAASVKVFAVKK
jgi:SAM-dependent methyltransferase/protein-tyrosine-phosphatase